MSTRMQNLIENMGGVVRVEEKPFAPLSREIMSKYLDVDKKEFSDYVDYLTYFGGETYLNEVFYKLTMYNDGLPITSRKCCNKKWRIWLFLRRRIFISNWLFIEQCYKNNRK